MNATIQYDQVQLYLYIDPLPTITIPMSMTTNFRRQQHTGLCTLKVILIGHSDIQKFIRMSIWKCSQYCVSDVITMHKLSTTPMKCLHCGCHLKEYENSRIICNRVIAQMIITETSLNHNFSVHTNIRVELIDNLCENLELGLEYELTGYMATNGIFKAMGIIPNCKTFSLYKASISFFPTIIQMKIHLDSKSPYNFVYILSSQLGVAQKLAPQQLFINFKMGILLSLASFKNSCDTIPLPILAVGFDTYFPNQLMSLASKYAVRCVSLSPNNSNIIGGKNKDGWYEIGSLSLANSGVCYLAMESGKMQLGESGSYRLPLKSAIWTYFGFQSKTKEQAQLQTLVNIFGMPFLSDPHDDVAYVQYILEQELQVNITSDDYTIIPEAELVLYLRAVNSRTVSVTPSTEELIKDYFVTCRRCREGTFPIRILDSLLLMAESHAKLHLRSETTRYDAVVAIWLLEESFQAMYGIDISNPSPQCTYEIEKIDKYFLLFEEWLYKFISTNRNNNNCFNFTQL
ncbi:uncharacterized protein LOC123296129 [Chrysoperla carnea]|uniref:uncharacterized protein LOC123296129 n=1 Tax=Chrysoperla carnea TaxID=189513 RepID=UPI001D05E909|nr:uncharacterized protein LOC123296129 [Chrysoperla carnea]